MSKMRKDAKDTLKLWAKLPEEQREFAMGKLLIDKVCLEKIIEMVLKTEDENKIVKKLLQILVVYYQTQKGFLGEFNKKDIDF